MEIIEDLSKDIACDFREEKRKKLLRTTLEASDVAKARAQGKR